MAPTPGQRPRSLRVSAFASVAIAVAALAACSGGDDASTTTDPSGDTESTADGTSDPMSTADCDGTTESPSTRFIVDECGRVVILRGANVESSSKGSVQSDSHFPTEGLDTLDGFERWGWNSVRFLVFWGAIEPEQGTFDEEYLDEVETWLDALNDRGLHVVLDMHQDLYGWKVGGNGAPDWATETDGLEFVGVDGDGPWYLNATDPATQNAYQNFWDTSRGHPELREHYLGALEHLAERFSDHPAVIGYDVMNEPVFANGDLNETLAIAGAAAEGQFDNPNLNEFMQQAIDTVRAADDEAWIMVEPTSLLNAFPYPGDLVGLTDPRDGAPRLSYAGHLYEAGVHDGNGYAADSVYVSTWESMRSSEAAALKAALWVGEWGGSAEQAGFDRYVGDVTTMLDEQMAGWSYWSWDRGGWGPLTGDDELSENGRLLLRVQPRAIAGTPESFTWDPATLSFSLTFTQREGVDGPTELAVPAELYPDGFNLTSSDADGTWEFTTDEAANIVRVTADPDADRHTITIESATPVD